MRTLTLLLLCVLLTAAHLLAQGELRPNILFIFTDDHGAQTIGAYGSYRNRTPGLDRLASEGMRFANCFCTNSICAPSRATILTGKHTHINGHTTNERIFDNRQQTFPQLLQQAGYQTALIGKWHLNVEPKGFDYWDILINQGVYYNPPMIRNGSYMVHDGYTTDIITDLTLDWLKKDRDPKKPFLLLSQHKAPHREWDPAIRHLTMFDDSLMPEPPTLFDDWSNRSAAWSYSEMSIEKWMWPRDLHIEIPRGLLTPAQYEAWEKAYGPKNEAFRAATPTGKELVKWKYQRYAKDYFRTVAAVDEGVDRLLDGLEQMGLAKNTIVVYSSDQGWFLGEHGMFDKRWMYEETFRMPLLVRWPGVITAGSVNHDLVQNHDFAPTFLEIAGVPVPSGMQGRSLLPLLRGTTPADWRKSVYYQFYEDEGAHKVPRHYGVRTDRYKLIHYYKIGEWELFDLQNDPNELVSLYGRPEYASITNELKAEVVRLRGQYAVTEEADRETDRFQQYQQARWKFISLLGKLPSRWDVKVDTLGRKEFGTYTREHIAYRIGEHRVEAFVLIPAKRSGPLPGIVAVHPGREGGSYNLGKSRIAGVAGEKEYAYALDLCQRGYVVMCPDRFGFESRRIPGGKNVLEEDSLVARAARKFLADGSTLLGQEVIELWFAADYLAKRPEVYYTRVGVVGYGEGGVAASVVASVNEEIWTTASLGGAMRFEKPGASELVNVPGMRSWGSFDNVVTGIYPRPFLEIVAQTDARPAFARAEERYRDRDFTGRLQVRVIQGSARGPSPEMRNAVYAWFDTWMK